MRTLWLVLLLMVAGSLAQAQNFQIDPFLSCVDVSPDGTQVTAYWGYESKERDIIQLPVSSSNRFIPNPSDRGQPVLFLHGLHERAFRMTFSATEIVQWSVLGVNVPASRGSKPCQAPTVYPSLPPAVSGVPYAQQLAVVGASGGQIWSATTALPPGLSLSAAGLLFGTPSAAGGYQIGVQVSDQGSTDARTYTLNVAGSVTVNDAVTLRAPGFTPVLRTATVVSSTVSATASCNANEFVLTGGGVCTVPNVNTVQGRVAVSQPTQNGWAVTCSGGTATAVAVCQAK